MINVCYRVLGFFLAITLIALGWFVLSNGLSFLVNTLIL